MIFQIATSIKQVYSTAIMKKNNVKNGNYLVKTILFVLVIGLSCLLFFGLGNAEKTTHELISFGILALSEFLKPQFVQYIFSLSY